MKTITKELHFTTHHAHCVPAASVYSCDAIATIANLLPLLK